MKINYENFYKKKTTGTWGCKKKIINESKLKKYRVILVIIRGVNIKNKYLKF